MVLLGDVLQIRPCSRQIDALPAFIDRSSVWRYGDDIVTIYKGREKCYVCDGSEKSDWKRSKAQRIRRSDHSCNKCTYMPTYVVIQVRVVAMWRAARCFLSHARQELDGGARLLNSQGRHTEL